MDFSFGYVDFDCTLANPAITAGFIWAALSVVAPLTLFAQALSRRRGPRALRLAAGPLLALGWLLANFLAGVFSRLALTAELFLEERRVASVGCMTSAPWWEVQLVLALAASIIGAATWALQRAARR
jgi:hypothetical protein